MTSSRSGTFVGRGLRVGALIPAGLLIAGVAVLGCPGTLTGKECFLQEERAQILLQQSCTGGGCHNASEKVYQLDLQTIGIGPRLKDKASYDCNDLPLIVPGKPEESALYLKLLDPPPCGSRMPLAQPAMYPEDIEVLRVWIAGMDGSCEGGGSGGSGGAGGASGTTSATTSSSTSEGGAGGGGTGGGT